MWQLRFLLFPSPWLYNFHIVSPGTRNKCFILLEPFHIGAEPPLEAFNKLINQVIFYWVTWMVQTEFCSIRSFNRFESFFLSQKPNIFWRLSLGVSKWLHVVAGGSECIIRLCLLESFLPIKKYLLGCLPLWPKVFGHETWRFVVVGARSRSCLDVLLLRRVFRATWILRLCQTCTCSCKLSSLEGWFVSL